MSIPTYNNCETATIIIESVATTTSCSSSYIQKLSDEFVDIPPADTTLWAIKTSHSIFVYNFEKCWSIFKTLFTVNVTQKDTNN